MPQDYRHGNPAPRPQQGHTTITVIDPNRELLDRAQTETYKETPEGKLSVHLFAPTANDSPSGRAAILFFFGSLWDQGTNTQFAPHCTYFAARGILTGIVDYRLTTTHGTTPLDAVSDARSAFRWLRSNADDLGIDPRKIVGAGASGGAHIVFYSSMTADPDAGSAEEENTAISGAPDCHIGFSPVLDTSPKGAGFDRFPDAKAAGMETANSCCASFVHSFSRSYHPSAIGSSSMIGFPFIISIKAPNPSA